MFTKSARFYDALYAWKDYGGEVERLRALIEDRGAGARTLLDVACGTGKHLELLAAHYEVEGLDVDERMLGIARERLAAIPLHRGSFVDFDLGRTFDVVTCLFSSIAYAGDREHLSRAVGTMARHVGSGGLLIVEPFFTPEAFEPGNPWAIFVDRPDLKIARMDVPTVEGRLARVQFHYLVATPEGVTHFTEPHVLGLFTVEEHLEAFRAAGLEVEHDPEGLMGRGLFVGRRP
ncbi:MAG: class I SAM-dependent DNA methyltransferase [Actinomycetota bacterium]